MKTDAYELLEEFLANQSPSFLKPYLHSPLLSQGWLVFFSSSGQVSQIEAPSQKEATNDSYPQCQRALSDLRDQSGPPIETSSGAFDAAQKSQLRPCQEEQFQCNSKAVF